MSEADALKIAVAPDELVASFVMLEGTVTTGAVVSPTVTVNVLLPVFRYASVAVQVTVVVPIAKVEPETGEQVGVIAPSTLSVAEAVKVTIAPVEPVASTVMFDGTVTTGAVISRTVTVKVLLPVLPAASVAEQVTVVVPIAKVEPDGGEQVVVRAPLTASKAEAAKVTTAPAELVASTVMFDGTVTTGAVVSTTVTVNVLLPVLPAASVAEQVTVVLPIAKVEPDTGKQVVVRAPLTASKAEAVKVTTAPVEPVACTVMSAGTVITGGVVSAGAVTEMLPRPLAFVLVPYDGEDIMLAYPLIISMPYLTFRLKEPPVTLTVGFVPVPFT